VFLQNYYLAFDKWFYPNFKLWGAGRFTQADQNVDSILGRTETTRRTIRPNIGLRLGPQLYFGELTYSRDKNTSEQAGAATFGEVRENYRAILGWTPSELPEVQFQFSRTNAYDESRAAVDRTLDLYQFIVQYRPIPPVYLSYRGSRTQSTNHLAGNEIVDDFHNGRVTYTDQLWDRRVSIYTNYDLTIRDTAVTRAGGGEIAFRLFPFEGLSALDDTPELGPLADNPALIDDNVTASAGIDLGLPAPGEDDSPRNLGVDFGTVKDVNTLIVWVDRDLPPEVSATYLWTVYTSSDNDTWTLREVVPMAPFDPFVPRFEVRFADVSTRYVKLVVDPLSPTVPDASSYPDILVTELQAESRVPVEDIQQEESLTSHLLDLNVRVRLLDRPQFYYELSSFGTKTAPAPATYTISNGLLLNHAFSDVYSVSARVTREDIQRFTLDGLAYTYTASLSVVPVPTLRYNVAFSGRSDELGGETTDRNAVFLYAVAELYPGVSVNVGAGKAYTQRDPGGLDAETTTINATSTIIPHRTLTLNLLYQNSNTTRYAVGSTGDIDRQTAQVNVGYTPVRTVFLFGSYVVDWRPDRDRQTRTNYAFSWAPFPDGTLHFSINYNEILVSELDQISKNLLTKLRWDIRRRTWLEVSYLQQSTEDVNRTIETDAVTAQVRFGF
jgi:hypothetical protein